MKAKSLVSLLACTLVFTGCQLYDLLTGKSGFLFDMAKETTPVIVAGTAKSLGTASVSKALSWSDPTYSMYAIFQDYSFPADEGKIDSGNLYKLLYESSQIYTNRKYDAKTIAAAAIASPFPFGNAAKTYDHAFVSIGEQGGYYDYSLAYKTTGDTTEACYGYTVREDYNGGVKTQRQVYETSFNEVTGSLALDFCTFDDKPGGTSDDFGRRAFVEGSMLDHSFFIHFVAGNGNPSTTVVGKALLRESITISSVLCDLCPRPTMNRRLRRALCLCFKLNLS